MLDPQERHDLFSVLRPPPGYELDRAIGTTFSLDLLTLLSVPLAFTLFGDDGPRRRDPAALLASVRQYADRILIFCQAGQISVPPPDQQLFPYLESLVFEVTPPREGGVFHPKLWLLRYVVAEETEEEQAAVRYRLLCLSRNLTFDRSWDTCLALEGPLTGRKNAYGRNNPLGDFFAALPDMLVGRQSLPPAATAVLAQFQREVRRVDFDLPPDVEALQFLPLGLGRGPVWPFTDTSGPRLVVSPFLSAGFLRRFAAGSGQRTLVSREESLSVLPHGSLDAYSEVYVMSPEAALQEEVPAEEVAQAEALGGDLSGLHAKLFICEQGWNATVWTGSANASTAAFERNVEFLIGLQGKRSRLGIAALLGERGGKEVGLLDLLLPFGGPCAPPTDPVAAALDQETTTIQRALARLPLAAEVTAAADASGAEQFDITLRCETALPQLPPHMTWRVWPVTLPEGQAVTPQTHGLEAAVFYSLSFAALTCFFAFEVVARRDAVHATRRFVLSVPLLGAPDGRRKRVLANILESPGALLRYLRFLLAPDTVLPLGEGADLAPTPMKPLPRDDNGHGLPFNGALFEEMVQALHRRPERLDLVADVLADLEADGEGRLPPAFMAIWKPIWAARQELPQEKVHE